MRSMLSLCAGRRFARKKVDLFVLASLRRPRDTLAELLGTTRPGPYRHPGGLEEKAGSDTIGAEMRGPRDAAPTAKDSHQRRQLLGSRSVPARTTPLHPEYSSHAQGQGRALALISSPGAFAVTRLSKHQSINPSTPSPRQPVGPHGGLLLEYLARTLNCTSSQSTSKA
jgi:hypothetical protein